MPKCAAAPNGGGPSRLQAARPVAAVAELRSLLAHSPQTTKTKNKHEDYTRHHRNHLGPFLLPDIRCRHEQPKHNYHCVQGYSLRQRHQDFRRLQNRWPEQRSLTKQFGRRHEQSKFYSHRLQGHSLRSCCRDSRCLQSRWTKQCRTTNHTIQRSNEVGPHSIATATSPE